MLGRAPGLARGAVVRVGEGVGCSSPVGGAAGAEAPAPIFHLQVLAPVEIRNHLQRLVGGRAGLMHAEGGRSADGCTVLGSGTPLGSAGCCNPPKGNPTAVP